MAAVDRPSWPALAYEARTWSPDPAHRGPRADRMLGTYRSAVVPRIAEAEPPLGAATRAAVRAVEDSARALQAFPGVDLGALTGALLRSESVASSKIERLSARQDEVALAAFGVSPRSKGPRAGAVARAVAANMAAMARAVSRGSEGEPVTLDDLLGLHRVLMEDDALDSAEAGQVRRVQNWIGGSDFSPRDALFVPPDPGRLSAGLEDLVAFCNRRDLPAVALAAIAHAQFETLHPFVDGNGRTGRALVQLLWRRTGLAPHVVIPVSTVLLADVDAYFAGLSDYRAGDVDQWVSQFAVAAAHAAVAGTELAARITGLGAAWRTEVRARAKSAVAALLKLALRSPVIDIHVAREHVGADDANLYRALERLSTAGVLSEVTGQGRNRVWFAPEVFELLEQFERSLGKRVSPTV